MLDQAETLTKLAPEPAVYDIIRNSRILIIDDSESNIKVLGALLKKYDCEVLTALTPQHGLSIAENKLPDLILLDVMMPDMDGFEVFQLLTENEQTKHIPVIYITSTNNSKNVVKGFEMGAVDYIVKPFHHDELIARIRNQLKRKDANTHIKALFNSKYYTFITINRNFEIVNFNNTASEREYLFTSEKYRVGDNILSHIAHNDWDFFISHIESVFKGKIIDFERTYVVNGERKWFNYIMEPIKKFDHSIIGCIINGIDITSKKESEIKDIEYHKRINDVYVETQQSLSYASYIQKAIFPSNLILSTQFKESFVLFRSKEKVSGDFYWTYDLGDKCLLVLGDCTGHGVPGALLTTISIVLLERIVKYQQVYAPEKILNELNNNIVSMLNQEDGNGLRDGLEMAICLFDRRNQRVEFAGARRSILIVKGQDLYEIKGDKLEIGGESMKEFNKQVFYPEKGSAIYVFSDGVTDQIGGERNKKFMKRNFSKLVLSLSAEPMVLQKEIIEETLMQWQGEGEQTDDILLIGLRI